MVYVKTVIVSAGVGLLAAAIWVFGSLFLPLYIERIVCSLQPSCGAGIGASFVGSGSTLLVALGGFALTFWWRIRKTPLPK